MERMEEGRSVIHWKIGEGVDAFDLVSPAEVGTMHCHATFNLGAVIEGHATLEWGGAVHEQPEGSTVLLNAFEAHASAWHAVRNRYFVIYFKEDAWAEVTGSLGAAPARVRLEGPLTQDRIAHHALLGLRAQLLQSPGSVRMVDLAGVLALMRARGLLAEDATIAPEDSEEVRRWLLDGADAPENPARRIGEVAEDAGLSRFQLSRRVRAFTGLQPRRLRLQLMVACAQADIAAGLSLSSAATRAGFADQSHMNREFRRTLGMTPRDYQRLDNRT